MANIERHQRHRNRLRNRAHPEREKENRTWKRYEETMYQTIRKAIKAQEQATERKVRKDANVLCELVLTFSPEMEEQIRLPEWVKANVQWVNKTFGKGKMIRMDSNMDERTPHLHCFVIMTDENGRFNSSRFFNKKKQIVEMQDSYANAMKHFGLERGLSKEQTGAKHQTLQEWKKAECERLEKEIADLTASIFADEKEQTKDGTVCSDLFNELL